jgi:hypothetical protein
VIAADRLAEVAEAFEAAISKEFGASVITKEDSPLHRTIADAFDVAHMGHDKAAELASFISFDIPDLRLPTGAGYLSDFGTTIAEDVALPRAWRSPESAARRILLLPHEVTHVTQHKRGVDAGWWPNRVGHSVLYLYSVASDDAAEYLGKVEGDAYGVSADLELWLTGKRRPVASVVDSLRRQYVIRPAGAIAAEAVLHSHYATQDDGGVANVTVGRWSIDWLNASAPDLRGTVTL